MEREKNGGGGKRWSEREQDKHKCVLNILKHESGTYPFMQMVLLDFNVAVWFGFMLKKRHVNV